MRAIKFENKNKLCELVLVGGGVMSGLRNQQSTLQKQSAVYKCKVVSFGNLEGMGDGFGAYRLELSYYLN